MMTQDSDELHVGNVSSPPSPSDLLTIKSSNFLEINALNINEAHEKVNILNFNINALELTRQLRLSSLNHFNLRAPQNKKSYFSCPQLISPEIFDKLDFMNFPNVFVIIVRINDQLTKEIIDKINSKLPKNRQMLLQINSRIFLRLKDKFDFTEIKINFPSDLIKNSKFSTEIFLILACAKVIDCDMRQVIDYFKNDAKVLLKKAIDSRDSFCVRLFNNFILSFSSELQNELFSSIIENKDYDSALAFLDVSNVSEITEDHVKKALDEDVNNNESSIFTLLSKALEFSTDRENFLIHDVLKNTNLKLTNEERNILINQGDEILKNIENLHLDIKNGNVDGVKKFIAENPKFKLCINNDVSALEYSLREKKFKIYSLLRAENFYTNDSTKLDELMNSLNYCQQNEIRLENLNYSQTNPDSCVGILMSKCMFDAKSPVRQEDVREMLFKLNKIGDIQKFFLIASQAEIKIFFDYANTSVKSMVPGCDDKTMGLVIFKDGHLYVGKDESMLKRYGVFAHELTHMVLYLIYENRCLPYCKGDSEREKLWVEILNKVKNFHDEQEDEIEQIVSIVFKGYSEGYEQYAELAVRVNHMIAQYLDDPQKVEELKKTFLSIFEFQREFVLRDLQIPFVYRFIKLNNDFGVLKSKLKVKPTNMIELINKTENKLIFTSNVPQLTMSKIFNEIRANSTNKLFAKVQNIYVDSLMLSQDILKSELNYLIEKTKIERILVLVQNLDDKNLNLFLTLKDIQIFFIIDDHQAFSLKQCLIFKDLPIYESIHQWPDLDYDSQETFYAKKIYFRKEDFKYKVIFFSENWITSKTLPILCASDSIELYPEQKTKKCENFIERKIEKKIKKQATNKNISEEFSLETFIKNMKGKISLLSDIAGSGKTTALWKIHEILLNEFPNHWISFVGLKDHIEELSEGVGENFEAFLIKILKLNPLEAKAFSYKFSKGEVIILFDAFDEISPKCKHETLELFKLFNFQEKNKIWITTRTHLEHELEIELNILAYRLKPLDKKEQIKYLAEVLKDTDSSVKIEESLAKDLVEKISKMNATILSAIGIPLIIEGLGNVLKTKQLKPHKLKISKLYDKNIKAYYHIIQEKFPEKVKENHTKDESLPKVHQYWAVRHFFGEDVASNLGLYYDPDEWSLEEIARGGIITYNKGEKVKFIHDTYAEYLVVKFIINFIKNVKVTSDHQLDLLMKILTKRKFQISRMFLEDMLTPMPGNLKILESCEKVCKFLTKKLNALYYLSQENLFTLINFILTIAKFDVNVYKSLVEYKEFESEKTILMELLPKIQGVENFSKLLTEIFEVYGDEKFEKFLLRVDYKNNTIFHHMSTPNTSVEILNKFYEVILAHFGIDEIKKMFFHKNKEGRTFLHFLVCENDLLEKIKISFKFMSSILSEEDQKALFWVQDIKYQNIFMVSAFDEPEIFFYIFEYVEKLMTDDEFKDIFQEDRKSDNILQLAAYDAKSFEVFEFLWQKVCEIFKDEKKSFFLKPCYNNKSLLHLSSFNSPEIFSFILQQAEDLCDEDELKKLILMEDSENYNLFGYFVQGTKKHLKVLFKKLTKIFVNENLSEILNPPVDFRHNLLFIVAENNPHLDAVKYNWKTLRKHLGENFPDYDLALKVLCVAAKCSKSTEIFKFLWEKISEYLKDDEHFLMQRGGSDSNPLQLSIQNTFNTEMFPFIFEMTKEFCESNEESKKLFLEVNNEDENLLMIGASSAIESNLKHLFHNFLETFAEEEIKNILKLSEGNKSKNLLILAVLKNNDIEAVKYLFEVYENNLDANDIKNILETKEISKFLEGASITNKVFKFIKYKKRLLNEKLLNKEN